jgi:GNAT superfamily N-acetyltransferase
MNVPIEIRPMRPEEAEAVSALIGAATRAGSAGWYPPAVVEACAAANSPAYVLATTEKQAVYVALLGGRLAAMVSLKGNQIGNLFVLPEHMRRGLGRHLAAFAAETCRAAGHTDLVVHASFNAVGFYRACGFVEEGLGSFDLAPGLPMQYVHMRRRLG